jgi:hypothetical protein
MATGYTESVTIDEGVDEKGIRTKMHFESSGDIVMQNTFDAEVHLEHAKRARDSTAGQKWGEGKFICHIPDAYLAPILALRDPKEREKAVLRFMQENKALVMFDRALL